jgi:hypothetical protein
LAGVLEAEVEEEGVEVVDCNPNGARHHPVLHCQRARARTSPSSGSAYHRETCKRVASEESKMSFPKLLCHRILSCQR